MPSHKNFNKKYEQIEHTGDIGLKFYGESVQDLFINAAHGMFDTIVEIKNVVSDLSTKIEASGNDLEELLVDWLSQLNFIFITENMILTQFDITYFSDDKISANIYGYNYEPDKTVIKTEIKAVTYHDIYVKKVKQRWEAQVIFDI